MRTTPESSESAANRSYLANRRALQRLGVINIEGRPESGISLPAFENLADSLHAQALNALLTFRGQAGGILVPHREDPLDTFGGLIHVVNQSSLVTHPDKTYINKEVFGEVDPAASAGKPITGWQMVIGENAPEMEYIHEGDDLNALLGKRREVRGGFLETNLSLSGTDRITYAAMLADHLGNGIIPDRNYWTMLDADSANSSSRAPFAGWFGGGPGFNADHPGDQNSNDRLRLWMKGMCFFIGLILSNLPTSVPPLQIEFAVEISWFRSPASVQDKASASASRLPNSRSPL